ncbi:uncharacterized protein LDX57_001962 [Aspergillus melleus]|uniref:uncharacterized protein n=1 Tax=Aspergillus melleus TaxID=138277 RepID=UPI001E8CDE8D|nr:uncharacterized protein LDX57_001962 [Aspergillus melleus]KAH8424205.1 hypothetical protein LDX57_001962 [Aspergillus melleus]
MAMRKWLVLLAKEPLWVKGVHRYGQSEVVLVVRVELTEPCIKPICGNAWVFQAGLCERVIETVELEHDSISDIGVQLARHKHTVPTTDSDVVNVLIIVAPHLKSELLVQASKCQISMN